MNATTVRTIVRCFSSSMLGFAALIAAGLVALSSTPAAAVSSSVRNACMSDYFAYCAGLEVGSKELRRCMNKAGPKLQPGCVQALVAAGEVSQAEVKRRAGKPTRTAKAMKRPKRAKMASAARKLRAACAAGPARPGAKASACRGGNYAQSRGGKRVATLR